MEINRPIVDAGERETLYFPSEQYRNYLETYCILKSGGNSIPVTDRFLERLHSFLFSAHRYREPLHFSLSVSSEYVSFNFQPFRGDKLCLKTFYICAVCLPQLSPDSAFPTTDTK